MGQVTDPVPVPIFAENLEDNLTNTVNLFRLQSKIGENFQCAKWTAIAQMAAIILEFLTPSLLVAHV